MLLRFESRGPQIPNFVHFGLRLKFTKEVGEISESALGISPPFLMRVLLDFRSVVASRNHKALGATVVVIRGQISHF